MKFLLSFAAITLLALPEARGFQSPFDAQTPVGIQHWRSARARDKWHRFCKSLQSILESLYRCCK